MPKNIILSGPTNSGKSTQIRLIVQQLADTYVAIDAWQELRKRSSQDDEIGDILRKAIANGVGAPQELVARIIAERITAVHAEGKFVAMAFSRISPESIHIYANIIPPRETVVISLDGLNDSSLLDRSKNRYIDPTNGNVYRLGAEMNGLSAEIRSRLELRPDDNPEILQKRLEEYEIKLPSYLEIWKQGGYIVRSLDATGNETDVLARILKAID